MLGYVDIYKVLEGNVTEQETVGEKSILTGRNELLNSENIF